MSRSKLFVAVLGSATAFFSAQLFASELITEQEAQLPAAVGAIAVNSRGITRGPKVVLVSPVDSGALKSPLALKVKFETYGGSKIDKDAVKVTYMKNPLVDLTKRLGASVDETGINLPDASVPPASIRSGSTSRTQTVARGPRVSPSRSHSNGSGPDQAATKSRFCRHPVPSASRVHPGDLGLTLTRLGPAYQVSGTCRDWPTAVVGAQLCAEFGHNCPLDG